MFPQGGNKTDLSNFTFQSSLQNTETRCFVLCEVLQDAPYWPGLVKQRIDCVFCKHLILVVSEGGKIGIYRVGQFTDGIIGMR